ncbi:MAG: hypothetical protein HYZ86_03055 [Candidatus Omnitrophica bacterium]|nr:hypothetical protein [Candidatus Omnitrophota bacterium]
MREKGQVTIPAGIRQSLHLSSDSLLSVARVGDGILLTPRPSVFEAVSAKFGKMAEEKGITLENLLKDLKKIRHDQ